VATYVLRRLLLAASVVVAVSFAAFVGFGLSLDPSYPFVFQLRKQVVVRATYHLTDPILSRYWRWASSLVHHGFGSTVSTSVGGAPPHLLAPGVPIGPSLVRATEISATMVGLALVIVIGGSAAVGMFAAQRRRFRADVGTRALVYLGAAVPTFLTADLIRRLIVPKQSTIVIANRYYTSTHSTWFLLGPPSGGPLDWLRHLTLPAVALGLGLIGIYARYVRSAMAVELGRPYVSVARAKGLTERRVLFRHALRNSLIPVASLLSLELGGVVGASLAADGVFRSGGLASIFLGALGNADPFQLTAIIVMSALLVSGFTLIGDIVVGLLDPRVSVSSRSG
jgi:peptide/nickel transport system permease protein